MFKFNKSSGQASRLLLVLAIVILVAVVIVYLVMRMAEKPPEPVAPKPTIPLPVYEQTLDSIRFVFESAIDKGDVLKASDSYIISGSGSERTSSQKDLPISNPGAKFIQVTIGAQNTGTENTVQNAWDLENIVDSQGRNYVPLITSVAKPWLPNPNLCSILLKPAFDPTPCVKIYEVSKESTGLKIRVEASKSPNTKAINPKNLDSFLIDLIVK